MIGKFEVIYMKIGRNEPCPCGSGKKYKKCCLYKPDEQRFAEAIMYSSENIRNEARIKQRLHPNKNECDGKIIKAHAIQNNRILNKISDNGIVITMDGVSNLIFQSSDKKGRKIATTFTGFCSYHDKTLFQDVEDKDFVGTKKQIFLLTYRTMAWHYHKKQEQANATRIHVNKMRTKGFNVTNSDDVVDYLTGLKLGMHDNEIEKTAFDKALLNETFEDISYVVWELPYEINIAISMMTALEHDILGNKINDLAKDEDVKSIYLNIFPSTNKSFCIWSWLKKNDNIYKPFVKQFLDLEIKDRENYFNNNLPRWSDSLVISPKLWNKWGEGIQQALITHANFDVLYRQMELEIGEYAYKFAYTPWNLFEHT